MVVVVSVVVAQHVLGYVWAISELVEKKRMKDLTGRAFEREREIYERVHYFPNCQSVVKFSIVCGACISSG